MNLRHQLDASAVLAVIQEERGAEIVETLFDSASIHAFNLAEVLTKLLRNAVPEPEVLLASLQIEVDEGFDANQAAFCARLHAACRRQGLSMGDCVCLTLAKWNDAIAVTSDRGWTDAVADRNIKVLCIR